MARRIREPMPPLPGQLVLHIENLRGLGIPWGDQQLLRMERSGEFPRRMKLSYARVGWDRDEVLAWLEEKKAQREAAA